jgi:hypothetical protein
VDLDTGLLKLVAKQGGSIANLEILAIPGREILRVVSGADNLAAASREGSSVGRDLFESRGYGRVESCEDWDQLQGGSAVRTGKRDCAL